MRVGNTIWQPTRILTVHNLCASLTTRRRKSSTVCIPALFSLLWKNPSFPISKPHHSVQVDSASCILWGNKIYHLLDRKTHTQTAVKRVHTQMKSEVLVLFMSSHSPPVILNSEGPVFLLHECECLHNSPRQPSTLAWTSCSLSSLIYQ